MSDELKIMVGYLRLMTDKSAEAVMSSWLLAKLTTARPFVLVHESSDLLSRSDCHLLGHRYCISCPGEKVKKW